MKTIPLLFALLVLASCATKHEKSVLQNKVANESSDTKVLVHNVDEIILASKTLTPKQKIDLKKIIDNAKTSHIVLTAESTKQKSVLIKELLSAKVDLRAVELLKKGIRKTEKLKLKNTLSAFDDIARVVVGDPESKIYLEHVMDRSIN
jgi:hypothetical protein